MGSDGKVMQWLDACVYWVGDSRQLWRWWGWIVIAGFVLLWWGVQWDGPVADEAPSKAQRLEQVALIVPKTLSTGELTSAAVQLQEFPWGPEAKKPVIASNQSGDKAAQDAPLRWQVQGTFLGDDGQRRLLVRFEGDKQSHQFLGVKQVLPNGWVLQEVDRFEVLVLDPAMDEAVWMPWVDLGKSPS